MERFLELLDNRDESPDPTPRRDPSRRPPEKAAVLPPSQPAAVVHGAVGAVDLDALLSGLEQAPPPDEELLYTVDGNVRRREPLGT